MSKFTRQAHRKNRTKPAFLKRAEIKELAERLNTSQFVVATVLQVAGHVLRERYRRRGWLPQKRDPAVMNERGVERRVIAAAIDEITLPAMLELAGVMSEQDARARIGVQS